VTFDHSVGSAGAIVSHAPGCRLEFLADVNARQVRLRNSYVAASIFADEVVLEDCVVIGGVFATRRLEMSDCLVGTFNARPCGLRRRSTFCCQAGLRSSHSLASRALSFTALP